MNVLVIGAGMMGSAVAYDLAHSSGVARVVIADSDGDRAADIARSLGGTAVPRRIDASNRADVLAAMKEVDVAIGATSYTHNVGLTQAAIHTGIHFCDLGGNMDVVYNQMELEGEAEDAGVCILPNCGLAPGMACVIAARAAERFDDVSEIRIRVGGLPQHPVPPLNYQLIFSAEGLINEYLEPTEVIRGGDSITVNSMVDVEEVVFPPPFGPLEAFNTSGGISTLTRMFKGKVRELNYKTIRYKGHCEKFKLLLDLGFAGSEPVMIGTSVKTVREFFEDLLRKKLTFSGPDVVLMRVTISGSMKGRNRTLAYEMIDYYDTSVPLTSMMRTTAFPTSIIAQMAVNGTISSRGVHPPEQCVPLAPFLAELAKRNIIVKEHLTP